MSARPFVEEIARDLPPGLALDLACGDGRNALWLADRGWQVTAVDRAPAFSDPRVAIHTADLEAHPFSIEPGSWDLILMSYYLQTDLYPEVLCGLKPGGLAIIIVLLHQPSSESGRFRLHPGELREFFRDQHILAYQEDTSIAQIAVERGPDSSR